MTGKTPSVFVSSTCYDLGQVRSDLAGFVQSIGLEPVLSEFSSFPVDPDENTVTNCMRVVDDVADIFVLIVGSRFGSTTSAGTSITNAEYLRARMKNIPIYVFVLKREWIKAIDVITDLSCRSRKNVSTCAGVSIPLYTISRLDRLEI